MRTRYFYIKDKEDQYVLSETDLTRECAADVIAVGAEEDIFNFVMAEARSATPTKFQINLKRSNVDFVEYFEAAVNRWIDSMNQRIDIMSKEFLEGKI